MAGGLNFTGDPSTLHMPTTTVKTAELNLDHDIAGEFEAAVDHSKLESRNKYDFMNLDGAGSAQPIARANQFQQLSPFNVS